MSDTQDDKEAFLNALCGLMDHPNTDFGKVYELCRAHFQQKAVKTISEERVTELAESCGLCRSSISVPDNNWDKFLNTFAALIAAEIQGERK